MSKIIHPPETNKDIWVGTIIYRAIRDTLRFLKELDNVIQKSKV